MNFKLAALMFLCTSFLQLSKDMLDEEEDINYSWIREYHWDVCCECPLTGQ